MREGGTGREAEPRGPRSPGGRRGWWELGGHPLPAAAPAPRVQPATAGAHRRAWPSGGRRFWPVRRYPWGSVEAMLTQHSGGLFLLGPAGCPCGAAWAAAAAGGRLQAAGCRLPAHGRSAPCRGSPQTSPCCAACCLRRWVCGAGLCAAVPPALQRCLPGGPHGSRVRCSLPSCRAIFRGAVGDLWVHTPGEQNRPSPSKWVASPVFHPPAQPAGTERAVLAGGSGTRRPCCR